MREKLVLSPGQKAGRVFELKGRALELQCYFNLESYTYSNIFRLWVLVMLYRIFIYDGLDSKDRILKILRRKKLSPTGYVDSISLVFVLLSAWCIYLQHFPLERSMDLQCPVLSAEWDTMNKWGNSVTLKDRWRLKVCEAVWWC